MIKYIKSFFKKKDKKVEPIKSRYENMSRNSNSGKIYRSVDSDDASNYTPPDNYVVPLESILTTPSVAYHNNSCYNDSSSSSSSYSSCDSSSSSFD